MATPADANGADLAGTILVSFRGSVTWCNNKAVDP